MLGIAIKQLNLRLPCDEIVIMTKVCLSVSFQVSYCFDILIDVGILCDRMGTCSGWKRWWQWRLRQSAWIESKATMIYVRHGLERLHLDYFDALRRCRLHWMSSCRAWQCSRLLTYVFLRIFIEMIVLSTYKVMDMDIDMNFGPHFSRTFSFQWLQ